MANANPKRRRSVQYLRWLVICLTASIVAFVVIAWLVAGQLIKPSNRIVGNPPADFPAESVSFESTSAASIKAWYRSVPNSRATVILLHPIRGDRRDMLTRAVLLQQHGYSTLLVDLQGHGESIGDNITIGYLEKFDVLAAVEFVRHKNPDHKIGIVGWSLGGAATALANPDIDCLVLESVYPTIEEAVHNRVKIRLGPLHHIVAPMLLVQLKPRLGISLDELRPIDHMAELSCPVLILSGGKDAHTPLAEARRMFEAAKEPKQLVVFEDAEHVDLLQFDRAQYEQEVMAFLESVLSSN